MSATPLDLGPRSGARAPTGWDAAAHQRWRQGQKGEAINDVVRAINRFGPTKPLPLVLQFVYYLFLVGDIAMAAQALAAARADYPSSTELLKNLAVCLTRLGRYRDALEALGELLALDPQNYVAYDALCGCHEGLGEFREAAAAGARSLELKNQLTASASLAGWRLPEGSPDEWLAARAGENVISYSLWGHNPRYLRGAIDNALASSLYPGWRLRFYVDETVPLEVRDELAALKADVRLEPPGQSAKHRLAWRFKVANDAGVGRFLVRDADSVIGRREKAAVDAWVASGRWFHVMRDWWTHTDLMLAGMWGGVAGVLPDLSAMLDAYVPPTLETENIDQWFLRDKAWPFVRTSCLVHDRCFATEFSQPWPEPPPPGRAHVGENVFAADRAGQERRLGDRIERLPSLQLQARRIVAG